MDIKTLTFKCNNDILTRTDNHIVINASVHIIKLKITFSEEWSDFSKNIMFKSDDNAKYSVYIGVDNEIECYIPSEVLNGHYFTFSCFGTTEDERLTTNQVTVTLMLSGYNRDAKQLIANSSDKFEDISVFLAKIDKKYDNIELQDDKLICYVEEDPKKVISLGGLILNNYHTKEYIDEKLDTKYDDFSYEDGYLLCFIDGVVKKKLPIGLIADDYYTKKEIDKKFNEIDTQLEKCLIDSQINSEDDGIYLILNTLKEE